MGKQQTTMGSAINYGLQKARDTGGQVVTDGKRGEFTIKLSIADGLPAVDLDTTGDGSADAYDPNANANIPAGARIKAATLRVTTAFVGGTSLTIGLNEADGSAIDADGIDVAVATAALTAGAVIDCDGALVEASSVLANDGYLVATTAGTYTAGEAELFIEFEGQNSR